MKWDPEDEIPDKRLQKLTGDYYIAHHPDGGCVYLDRETELCKIHGKFGYEEKPLGCKIYPYSIVTTFENEYSVIGRFDCSAVRDKDGDPMRQAMGDARNYIDEMNLQGGFDERILDGLNRNTIDMIIRV